MAKKKGSRKRGKKSAGADKAEAKEPVLSEAVSKVIAEKEDPKAKLKECSGQVLKWTADGFDTKCLDELLKTEDIDKIKAAMKDFEIGISKSEEMKEELDKTDLSGFDADVSELRVMLGNPGNYKTAGEKLDNLKKRKRSSELRKELDKMVLPNMKSKVDGLKGKLSDLNELDTIEREMVSLRAEYKEKYFETGIISDVRGKTVGAPVAQKKEPGKRISPMLVSDIFLLYKDGRFISHHTARPVPKDQQTRLFADLKTGRNYLRSPKYLPQKLNVVQNEGRNVIVQSGRFTVVIMVVEGDVNPWTERIIGKVLGLMEKEDGPSLNNWTGDVASLKSSAKYMQALLFACMKLSKGSNPE
jgi:hypothetical protein